jgi:hypothetical protein
MCYSSRNFGGIMNLDQFLTQLLLDVEDIQSDVEFDLGHDSVPGQKLNDLKKMIEEFSNEV